MGFSKKDCPIVADFLLAFRKEFGEVTVQYMKEGNVTHGTPSTGDYVPIHVEPARKK